MNYKRAINILFREFPVYYLSRVFNILPNNIITCRLRGKAIGLFLERTGKNLQIAQDLIINYPENMYVENNVYIAHRAYINARGGIFLGDNVTIGPNVVMATGNHVVLNGKVENDGNEGRISIGEGTWIGGNVTITDNISIGKGCVIGAGSVVTHDVSDDLMVGGCPAKVIERKEKKNESYICS